MTIPSKILIEIVTPDRAIVRAEVDEIQLPGSEGYFGVLPGHTPLLATLTVGQLWYRVGQDKHFLAVAGGFVEVLPDHVTVLAQIAERADEIDLARAEAAKKRAEERLARREAEINVPRAQRALEKAALRIQVAMFSRTRTRA